ncbi:MAG: DUF362 domain-containing protein [Paludibaculum sp.]
MTQISRRGLLESAAAAGLRLGFGASVVSPALMWAAPGGGPSMAISKYKSSPAGKEAVAEEARQLTTQVVNAMGGMSRFVAKGDVVWVKPNIGWNRVPEQAATTNPDVVATVVSLCYAAGAKKVIVSDNSCNPAPASFARSGIQAAAQKAGAESLILDERKFRRTELKGKVLSSWEIYTDILGVNKFINIPIVKHHSLCRATLGMKNLMGVAGGDRNRFHQDLSNTLTDLATFFKPTLVVMDAIRVLTANGPIGGNLADVKRLDTVAASVDQVAIDAWGASLLGLKAGDIGYIAEASSRKLGNAAWESLKPVSVAV